MYIKIKNKKERKLYKMKREKKRKKDEQEAENVKREIKQKLLYYFVQHGQLRSTVGEGQIKKTC